MREESGGGGRRFFRGGDGGGKKCFDKVRGRVVGIKENIGVVEVELDFSGLSGGAIPTIEKHQAVLLRIQRRIGEPRARS